MILDDAEIRDCALCEWQGDKARCRWCDAALEGRRYRWCSDACANAAYREHHWNTASYAIKRDVGECERCGAKPGRVALPDGTFTRRVVLEAHHREHALGRHTVASCIHHRANLECVCHECHVKGHVDERRLERSSVAGVQLELEVSA